MNKSLKYTKRFINSNFRLKVYGKDENGKRINKLVGVAGLIALIGIELLNKFIDRALKAGLDCCKCYMDGGDILIAMDKSEYMALKSIQL